MTAYMLIASTFRQIVERAPDGAALRIVKHRRGAIITDLDESEAQRLLLADAIVPAATTVAVDEGEGEGQDEGDNGQGDGGQGDNGQGDGGQGDSDPDAVSTGDQGGDTPLVVGADGPPLKTAGVAEWRAYAESKGLSKADAADLSRAELISRYGAR